jgi:type II secretory pathway component PulF
MSADPLDHSVTEALRALRTQHSAGVTVSRAMETCATVCILPAGRDCFLDASRRADKGESIESLMQALSPVLSEAERTIICAGWNGGRVEAVLDSVISQRELWEQARRRIRSQMILPFVVLIMAAFIAPLPNFIAGNGTIVGYLFSALIPIVIGVVVWTLIQKSLWSRKEDSLSPGPNAPPAPPTSIDRYKLELPVVRNVERNRCLAEFSSVLGNLISAGVTITTALQTCSRAADNGIYRQAIAQSATVTQSGNLLATSMTNAELWPPEFVNAVEVGEKTGKLDEVLLRYSSQARDNYVRAVEIFAAWVPKVLYGLVCLFVIYNIFSLYAAHFRMIEENLPN